jgi:hypothetical protein
MNAKSYASTLARDKGLRVMDGTFPIRAIGNFHVARIVLQQGSVFAGVLLARHI